MNAKKWMIMALAVLMLFGTACQSVPVEDSSTPTASSTKESGKSTTKKKKTTTKKEQTTTEGSATTTPSKTGETSVNTTKDTTKTTSTTKKTSVSTKKTTSSTTKKTTTTKAYLDYTKYSNETYLEPFWKGNVVYNETAMFVPNAKTGEIEAAPLMYKPTKILSVRSYTLAIEYEEGRDYTVTKDGRIKLTANSRIPTWKYDDFYTKAPGDYGIISNSATEAAGATRYLKYAAGSTFLSKQVAVTYTHSDKWDGPVPTYQGSILKKTTARLKEGKALSIVYNGDSITVGAESSRWNNYAPFAPIWTEMVTERLLAEYNSGIVQKNTAVGGMDSAWGLENVEENINKYNPNLVVLAFGMNDGSHNAASAAKFRSNIKGIIDKVRAKNPECEFILVSTTLPNPDAGGGWTKNQPLYEKVLTGLAGEYEGIAVAKMTEMHKHILTLKRYWDMTGNNINHPNDYLARFYAQVVSQMLIEEL